MGYEDLLKMTPQTWHRSNVARLKAVQYICETRRGKRQQSAQLEVGTKEKKGRSKNEKS